MKILTFFLTLLFSLNLSAQKYFHQWPYGYGPSIENDFGISILDFNEDEVTTYPYFELLNFGLGDGGSFICNKEGELILMTNNCEVKNSALETIEGGDQITPLDGEWDDQYCDGYEYPQTQGTLFLPELNNDSVYYLIHRNSVLIDTPYNTIDLLSNKLFLSTIVQRKNNSYYVKEKNLVSEKVMKYGNLTATPHVDKKRWWLVSLGYYTNDIYTYLIGGDSLISGPFIQSIGDSINNLYTGQNLFSPDGKMMALNSSTLGIMLYDFDPATGLFSNYRNIKHTDRQYSHELAFSPSGRFLYSTTTERLLQFDLLSDNVDDINASKYNLGHIRTRDETGWPVGIGSLHLGPDCRIYVSPGTTTYYMHVIHQPDQKGAACMYEERAIRTPTIVLGDLPNVPNYHYLSPCDSTIEWGILSTNTSTPDLDKQVTAFPNPVYNELRLEWTFGIDESISHWVVYDLLGRLVQSGELDSLTNSVDINTSDWNAGSYFVQLQDEQGVVVAVKKVIKN